MMPWEFAELPMRKKAALIGMIQAKVDQEKRDRAKAKKK